MVAYKVEQTITTQQKKKKKKYTTYIQHVLHAILISIACFFRSLSMSIYQKSLL